MPLNEDRKFDPKLIAMFLSQQSKLSTVVIERQHAMPKQGVASTFTTGFNYGQLVGIAVGMGFDVEVVSARTWKGALLPDPLDRKGKAGTIRFVKERWPETNFIAPRCRIEHDGMADAAAIVAYCLGRP
jgi:crossover junction endodeoxyribonuclease RuvC